MASFNEQTVEGVRLLRVSGSLTQDGVSDIEPAFEAALPDGMHAVVNLADVDVITTPGLTLFISLSQRLRNTRGRVVFTSAQPGVADLFKRCRLEFVLDIAADSEQAMARARD